MRAWLPVVLTVPFALAGCPAVLSDWTISGSDAGDASPGASPNPDAGGGGAGGALVDAGMPGASGGSGCPTGAVRCSGIQPQACISDVWLANGSACPEACLNGACATRSEGGSCNPAVCPAPGTGTACCTTTDQCGTDFGHGCVPAAQIDAGA